MLYLSGSQPSVCFDTSAFWWIGLRLWTYKAVWNFKRDLGLNMPIRIIKALFVREKRIRIPCSLLEKAFPKKQHAIWIFYFQMLLSASWQRWLIICSWLSTQCLTDTHCENVPRAMLNFVPLKDEFFPSASSGSWSLLLSLSVPQ